MEKITELLMCPPVYPKSHPVQKEFNKYMSEDNQPDVAAMMREWVELLQKVLRAGARVHIIEPVAGLGDMVFAANAFWGRGGDRVFVMSNHAPHHRRPERKHYARWLIDHGYSVLYLTQEDDGEHFEEYFFAGQGMVVSADQEYFIGYGLRTTVKAIDRIQKELRLSKLILPLKLPDDGSFYDLDVCMHYSREADALLYYPGAFDKDSLQRIERAKVTHLIELPLLCSVVQELPEENSWNFRLNAPYIGNVEIFPNRGPVSTLPKQIRQLEKLGRQRNIELATIHLPQHGKLGGGARCPIGFLT